MAESAPPPPPAGAGAPPGPGAPDIKRPSPRRELAALNFDKILGGPMSAVINAQAASAMTTVDFIKKVGFHKYDPEEEEPGKKKKAKHDDLEFDDDIHNKDRTKLTEHEVRKKKEGFDPNETYFGRPVNVTFQYERRLPSGMPQPVSITVPFLTIIPIPTLRIEQLNIHFLAKITSMHTRKMTSQTNIGSTVQGVESSADSSDELKPWQRSMTFTGTVAAQKKLSTGFKESRSYSLSVKCTAVNDELPAGMDRILSLLEGAIAQVNSNPDMAPQAMDAPL